MPTTRIPPKIIWTCWFQGRMNAPAVVQRCLESWEAKKPDWDVRCLDAFTIQKYAYLSGLVDLKTQTVTSASLSDIVRIQLLHEFGGVWVDATLYCNQPLDHWLPEYIGAGFFAFAAPAPGRPLASWFLAAVPNHFLIDHWYSLTCHYWQQRRCTDDYFWFHHLFQALIDSHELAGAFWSRVPKISADGPHAIQFKAGIYRPADEVVDLVDWTTPVFKLTYRIDPQQFQRGCLLDHLLSISLPDRKATTHQEVLGQTPIKRYAALKVATENLGDHLQIIAGLGVMARIGLSPDYFVDRDNEIATAACPDSGDDDSIGILLNGWFKTNGREWPPDPRLVPVFLGFHARLFQCPELLSPAALDYYRRHQPIGCRDQYTAGLLGSHDIGVFESHCLTLTFPRRPVNVVQQKEVFVVSRDERILTRLPPSLKPYTFVSHYSGNHHFDENLEEARRLVDRYRTHARLIVTSLLHCALPAIAMGIPVVVFYPPNDSRGHASDVERFSSLQKLVRIYHLDEIEQVDWRGQTVDVSALKLAMLDAFYGMAATRWGVIQNKQALGPIAPSSVLPVPAGNDNIAWAEQLKPLLQTVFRQEPDRERWGKPESYCASWDDRARSAAELIPDGVSVFEIGVGAGAFRSLVKHRCRYQGADLVPQDEETLRLNLDQDPIPVGKVDLIVMLGVAEYLHHLREALTKICLAAGRIVMTYCCCHDDGGDKPLTDRQQRGWVNALTKSEVVGLLSDTGFYLESVHSLNATDTFHQFLFLFSRGDRPSSDRTSLSDRDVGGAAEENTRNYVTDGRVPHNPPNLLVIKQG